MANKPLAKPPGVPQSFWEEVGPQLQEAFNASGKFSASVEKQFQDHAQRIYDSLDANAQKAYVETDKKNGVGAKPGTPEAIEERTLDIAEKTSAENKAAWDELANLPLNELASRLGLSNEEAQAAHDQFVSA